MRIHLTWNPEPAHLQTLVAAFPDLTMGDVPDEEVDVLVGGRPRPEALARLRRGGAFVLPFSGVPPKTRSDLLERPDVAVYNLHHNAVFVAEHTIAMVLAASRRIVPMDAALRRGDWRPRFEPDQALTLAGRSAVVLGFGAIGRRVATILQSLGMSVLATRRRSSGAETIGGTEVHPGESLDALLPRAQVLVIALPHTDETEGLLDARRLSLLPKDAVLVNIARGAIIEEAALYEALRDHRIHSAGLDVWWRYPDAEARESTPPSEHPLHELDNVVLSPHRAGHARQTEALRTRHLVDLLSSLVRGEAPDSRVDLDAGY